MLFMNKSGLIAIAGVIGVGKTTLARGLAGILPARLILEEYDRNPFLASEFAGDHDAALPCELFFLLSRLGQLKKNTLAPQPAVCDYIFQKNRIFAQYHLDSQQFGIFDQVEKSIRPLIAGPEVVIYLHDTVENCLERIVCRGREYERVITCAYLACLKAGYEELFTDWDICPVVRLDCAEYDLRRPEVVGQIADIIRTRANNPTAEQVSAGRNDFNSQAAPA